MAFGLARVSFTLAWICRQAWEWSLAPGCPLSLAILQSRVRLNDPAPFPGMHLSAFDLVAPSLLLLITIIIIIFFFFGVDILDVLYLFLFSFSFRVQHLGHLTIAPRTFFRPLSLCLFAQRSRHKLCNVHGPPATAAASFSFGRPTESSSVARLSQRKPAPRHVSMHPHPHPILQFIIQYKSSPCQAY